MNAASLSTETMKSKLIVALDVETACEARDIVARLRGLVGMFKIGSQLFTSEGPVLVREIVKSGEKVFLDLKFHDIPNTVANACREAARLGVSILNVHASGGSEMMRRASEAVAEVSDREGLTRPSVIGVTVLTSSDSSTLAETGIDTSPEAHVTSLARLAAGAGLDGVVASPHEIRPVRKAIPADDFLIVTPGVRPAKTAHDDQKRVMTPLEAVSAGASYIVVGRAILKATDPAQAAMDIVEEISRK